MKRLIILGATGSIGTSTLDVVRDFPDRFEVVGLSTHGRVEELGKLAHEFGARAVCVSGDSAPEPGMLPNGVEVYSGPTGLTELVRNFPADMLVVATVGFAGLFPTLEGIRKRIPIALANKEVLVVAGEIVMSRARAADVPILPIDSEHNAIFQCLAGNDSRAVRRIMLTASGGSFRDWPMEKIRAATPEQALDHPTWDMGPKITIDSATLMNKGLEVIEACHLFDVSPDQVDVVVHPQSTIHSMVEYVDGSILAQMGQTDMYLPILNVLTYPERTANKFEPLDLARLGRLDFRSPDRDKFPCLDYAFEAIRIGGTMPAILNGANEVAVQAFLDGRIAFPEIAETIRSVMDRIEPLSHPDLDALKDADLKAREMAGEYAGNLA